LVGDPLELARLTLILINQPPQIHCREHRLPLIRPAPLRRVGNPRITSLICLPPMGAAPRHPRYGKDRPPKCRDALGANFLKIILVSLVHSNQMQGHASRITSGAHRICRPVPTQRGQLSLRPRCVTECRESDSLASSPPRSSGIQDGAPICCVQADRTLGVARRKAHGHAAPTIRSIA
jgi:hypothetical protein